MNKATLLIKDAEKLCRKRMIFMSPSETSYEEARATYVKAAALFKCIEEYYKAAECYIRASDISKLLRIELDVAEDYNNAAIMFSKVSSPTTSLIGEEQSINNAETLMIDAYNKSLNIYESLGKCKQVATILSALAEFEFSKKRHSKSSLYYLKARDNYKRAKYDAQAQEMSLHVANIYMNYTHQYNEARDLYHSIAVSSLEDRLLKFSSRKYLFNALLCELMLIPRDNLTESIMNFESLHNEYQELDPLFDTHTRVHTLI